MTEKVITPEFRVSFPYLFRPNDYNGKQKFGLTMLFEKGEDLSKLKKLCVDVATEKWGKVPKPCKMPFRDGDKEKDLEKYPSFGNKIFAQAQSMYQPGLVDNKLQPILDESEFYAGCYARASIGAFAWEHSSSGKGVSLTLLNVQKTKDGDKFGGRVTAEDEFDVIEINGNIATDDFEDDDFEI